MSHDVNKVILADNLDADPEVWYFPNGGATTKIRVATSESWKSGEYLQKGSKIYMEGSLKTRKWSDRNGQDHYTTEIIAKQMQIIDSNRSSSNNDSMLNEDIPF